MPQPHGKRYAATTQPPKVRTMRTTKDYASLLFARRCAPLQKRTVAHGANQLRSMHTVRAGTRLTNRVPGFIAMVGESMACHANRPPEDVMATTCRDARTLPRPPPMRAFTSISCGPVEVYLRCKRRAAKRGAARAQTLLRPPASAAALESKSERWDVVKSEGPYAHV